MHPGVFGLRHHLEIFWSVIGVVAIDVVDDLRPKQRTPDLLFRHEPILVNVRAAQQSGIHTMGRIDHGAAIAIQDPPAAPLGISCAAIPFIAAGD